MKSAKNWGFWQPPAKVAGRVRGADRVELKLLIADSALATLGIDLRSAPVRRVSYLDTDDLALTRHGVVVRVRTTEDGDADCAVKLRPLRPGKLPGTLRRARDFVVDLDALPGNFVWAGTMKKRASNGPARLRGRQRRLLATYGPPGVDIADLREYGPAEVRRRRFRPKGLKHTLTVEQWAYPDGSRLLEISTRCPARDAAKVAARTATVLRAHGIGPAGPQLSKTQRTLACFR